MVSKTTQLKLLAPDGKNRNSDVLDCAGIVALGKEFPGKKANRFIDQYYRVLGWFLIGEINVIL